MAAYLNYNIFQRLRFKKLLNLCFTAINCVYCIVKVSIIIYNWTKKVGVFNYVSYNINYYVIKLNTEKHKYIIMLSTVLIIFSVIIKDLNCTYFVFVLYLSNKILG